MNPKKFELLSTQALQLNEHLNLTAKGKVLLEARFGKVEKGGLPKLLAAAEALDLQDEQRDLEARKARACSSAIEASS